MVLFLYLCNYTYEQDAGLAAKPPHLKEQRDEQMRLWRMVELSPKMRPNREYFWRDRFYNYAIKLAAATFKRSIGTGSIFGGIDSHA